VTRGPENIMKRKPRRSADPLVDNRTWKAIVTYSAVIAACCLMAVYASHLTVHHTETWNTVVCNNILFYTLILSQLFHAYNMDGGSTSLLGARACSAPR
jgi:P-type Ca2+ transporter type 2C